ncbi:MAG TPA: hypothetical protein VLA09_05410 [Longimicrobiales bacterium]|nr:hypothetical protein [Longimicrobiales bacterium]
MGTLALIVASIALVIAVAAFVRTGGIPEVRRQAVEARERAADALSRIEHKVRPADGDQKDASKG